MADNAWALGSDAESRAREHATRRRGTAPWDGDEPPTAVERGTDPALPTLQATAGGLARLWTGTLPASGIALTGALDGPAELIAALDATVRTPRPVPDWPF